MKIIDQKEEIDVIYIFGATSMNELQTKISEKEKDGYKVIGQHRLDLGEVVEYNARLMKY